MSLPHTNDRSSLDKGAVRPRGLLKRGSRMTSQIQKAPQGPANLAVKNHFIAMVGEYVGTVLFLIFAFGGTNVALIPTTSVTGSTTTGEDAKAVSTVNTSNLLFIALSFGFSLAVNAWIFFRISGGLFNPAVSLGMVLVGALTPLRGALLAFSQILGGITGAAIIDALTPDALNVQTTLGGGTSIVQGLFIEMFLTSLLMLAILLLAAEKHKATFIAPIGIGLALFVAELLGVYYTGGSLNPARSFGPAVVLHSFKGYHWIYWVGPALGATIAAGFYKMLKWLQYETVLGPETDGETPQPPAVPHPAASTVGDEEKATESHGRTLAVTGPGLGDLLTSGPGESADDINRQLGPVPERLDRIENLLAQLLESRMRESQSTYVDRGHSPAAHSGNGGLTKLEKESPTAATITSASTTYPASQYGQYENQNKNHGYAQTQAQTLPSAQVHAHDHDHEHGEGVNHHTPFTGHDAAGSGDRGHIDLAPR